jgi:hypothetical protein
MCKTDVALEAESCDFRLFQLDKEKTILEDVENSWEKKQIY